MQVGDLPPSGQLRGRNGTGRGERQQAELLALEPKQLGIGQARLKIAAGKAENPMLVVETDVLLRCQDLAPSGFLPNQA